MAKNNKPASAYASQGVAAPTFKDISVSRDPNTIPASKVTKKDGVKRVSMGDPGADITKRDGVKQRGHGAATKGYTSRGPLF